MEIIRPVKLSQKILAKLEEFESNKNIPFSASIFQGIFGGAEIYEISFLVFDKNELCHWSMNRLTGEFEPRTVFVEIHKDFWDWISQFNKTTKQQLIDDLMAENEDVFKIRCERCNADFEKAKKEKRKRLERNFRTLV